MKDSKNINQLAKDIDRQIEELKQYAEQHGLSFSLDSIPGDAEYVSSKEIQRRVDDEWLSSYHSGDSARWLTSSDYC